MEISQDGRALILRGVTAGQAGRYSCKAGSETQAFELAVLDRVQETVNFVPFPSSNTVQLYFKVLTSPTAVTWFVTFCSPL